MCSVVSILICQACLTTYYISLHYIYLADTFIQSDVQ
uniref:Uncharacterized protein n=1 Tax=Anguilla anguilla TaxID=7936 RepID=A0A0E9VVH3_ANGAN